MPTLFKTALSKNQKAVVFPIHEYWLDIGKMQDYVKAQDDYTKIFGD